jgi:hypothetical protein
MRELGDIPPDEERLAEDVLERNALLGDYSGDSDEDDNADVSRNEETESHATRRNGPDS